MKYRIVFEADKHWGVTRPEDQYQSSFIIKKYLAEQPVDLYINLGDFFDTKLLLNSKASIYAVRDFQDKVAICRARGIPVRAIKGTRGHDYDQWDIFDRTYKEKENDTICFRTCTSEETLPGLQILYCPEENVNFADYVDNYYDIITRKPPQLCALHGNFDKIMPAIAVQMAENDASSTTLVYHYEDLERTVHGPLIAGHWHTGETYRHLSYVGSYDRWSFGEMETKGFMVVEYNTDTETYRQIRVPNILAPVYKTYEVHTSVYTNTEAYAALIEAVDTNLKADPVMHIRILVKIDAEQANTEQQLSNLKFRYANNKRVHITVINQLKKEKKAAKKEETKRLETSYSYIKDPNMTIQAKIREFILQHTGHDYTEADIMSVIGTHLESK